MEKVDETLMNLINGERVPTEIIDVIFGNAAEFVPRTMGNVGYIVGGLLFNDEGKILMMQEAKKSCRGKWYLPMGRLEAGENLQEGAVREVLEETGLEAEPITALLIEWGGTTWFRIIFIMKQTGGTLKTQPDEESLKADWFDPDQVLNNEIPIRAGDIIRIIKKGLEYKSLPVSDCPTILPTVYPHTHMLNRIILHTTTQEGDHAILVNTHREVHLPCCMMGPNDMSIMVSIFNLCKDAFGRTKQAPEICGIVSVEHCGHPKAENDGMCLTSLIHSKNFIKLEGVNKKNYDWHVVTDASLISKLNLLLEGKHILPFLDVHSKVR